MLKRRMFNCGLSPIDHVADRMWPERGPDGFQTFTDGFLFWRLNRTFEMDFYAWL